MGSNAFVSDAPVIEESVIQKEPRRRGRSRFKGVNPLLRVSKPQVDTPEPIQAGAPNSFTTSGTPQRDEYVYATGAFDRQQSEGRGINSRWLRHQSDLKVPGLDEHLTVAFQKLLRVQRREEQERRVRQREEQEFLVLLIAMSDEDDRHAA